MTKIIKVMFISLLIFIISLGFIGCNNQENAQVDNSKTIAEYEGGVVTEAEFNKYLKVREFFDPQIKEAAKEEDVKKQVLEQYISEKYLTAKAGTEKDFNDQANNLFSQFKGQLVQTLGSEGAYEKSLKDLGITEDEVIAYIKRIYKIEDYFIVKQYNENKEEFTMATVSHILVEINEERTEEQAKVRAEEVLTKLKAGGDFSALAKEYSDDPGSKDNGGRYEDTPTSLWVEEFKKASLTLPINEVSDLVKTDYGYHIIKVEERYVPKMEELTEEQKNRVYSQEYTTFLYESLPSIIKSIKF